MLVYHCHEAVKEELAGGHISCVCFPSFFDSFSFILKSMALVWHFPNTALTLGLDLVFKEPENRLMRTK